MLFRHIPYAATALFPPTPGRPYGGYSTSAGYSVPKGFASLNLAFLPPRSTYPFVVRRGQARVTVEITSARANFEGAWGAFCTDGLMGVIGLLAVWRGRNRPAAGLALWASAFLTAAAISYVPSYTVGPVLAMWSFYLLARVGFYPGEHSVAGKRDLPAHVAHEIAAALFALSAESSEARAKATEAQLRESRAREQTLLEALRTVGTTATP